MIQRGWSWAGACSVGTSHLRAGRGCDDAAACIELNTNPDPTLIAVVSDGAGSADLSRLGSRIVAREFCKLAGKFILDGGRVEDVDENTASDWIDTIRDRISLAATMACTKPQAFAATLVGCIVRGKEAAIIHIGDGACALRVRGSIFWSAPSWPAQGEYAGTTYFVTDDPEARINVVRIREEVEELALFTDGLERLALNFSATKPFDPFFESIFASIRSAAAGRQRQLSQYLRAFLDSELVTERTDDDKTLIMARRTELT